MGERYRAFEDWERDELISNLVGGLMPCTQEIKERMVYMFSQCDEEYGRRVAEGLGMSVPTSSPSGVSSGANGVGQADSKADSITSPTASGEVSVGEK